MVQSDAFYKNMAKKLSKDTKLKPARITISFTEEMYEELEKLAEKGKVSLAWVVRDAVEKYISEEYPLLKDL